MPFDPNIPADHADLTGAMFRGQFNGLKDLIDTIPVGPPGQNGSDGTSVTGAIIDGTNTLNPGDAAQASVSWDGANVRFTFGIPRGQDGVSSPPITSFIVDGVSTLNPGEPATANASFDGSSVRLLFAIPRGSDGTNGSNGNDGGQGPPFTNFIVDGVNMLNPTDPASVQTNFDGSAVRIIFNIPRGFTGNDGGRGPQGSPGEVTNGQLSSAVNGTSNNSNAVNTLAMIVSDPPTVGEVQAIASKLDELILALRRS
ncbi:MAG: hypothetical protein ACKVY0_13600 [Prosthecobacter sp.]|uniref:hypothetical protein n=1 Tax=Prosthecobacter sp. TaxID=1965333 RepID=UPI003903C515